MGTRLEPAALQNPAAFELLAVLTRGERVSFLQHYFWKRPTAITRLHHVCTALMLLAAAASGWAIGLSLKGWLAAAGLALVTAVVAVVPLHEAIHAIAYKALGAPDVRCALSLRDSLVCVTAHRFVIRRSELMWVAILPSVVVTALLASASAGLPSVRTYLLITMLIHHLGSRGDWAYLNYFWLSRGREIYMFDDTDSLQSFFYTARAQNDVPSPQSSRTT